MILKMGGADILRGADSQKMRYRNGVQGWCTPELIFVAAQVSSPPHPGGPVSKRKETRN